MTDGYYKPIERDLDDYFYAFYWADILDALGLERFDNQRREARNNGPDALIQAIRAGRVDYQDGVFTGSFNAAISRELREFATFSSQTKQWRGDPPPAVKGAAVIARSKGEELSRRIESLIDEIPQRVAAQIQQLSYSIDTPLFAMSDQATRDLRNIGIDVDITPEVAERLISEYTNNQNLNIQNWTPEQTERLRDMIRRNALRGYNRVELREMIASEFGVTMNKAKFLARQETSLFMATVRDARYSDGGVEVVQWSTSNDIRVVGNPAGLYPQPTEGHGNHYALNGKFCLLSDPTVYADTLDDARAGKWKSKAMIGAGQSHAGVEFGCRCTYKPILL